MVTTSLSWRQIRAKANNGIFWDNFGVNPLKYVGVFGACTVDVSCEEHIMILHSCSLWCFVDKLQRLGTINLTFVLWSWCSRFSDWRSGVCRGQWKSEEVPGCVQASRSREEGKWIVDSLCWVRLCFFVSLAETISTVTDDAGMLEI